jgi:hypothetical protein
MCFWLSALAMACFADYHNSVLLLTWCRIFRILSDLSVPFYIKYVFLIIGSRHDVFRWSSNLCAFSSRHQLFRLLSELHAPCSMKYVSLIISSRHDMFRWSSHLYATLAMVSDISLVLKALCSVLHKVSLADYTSQQILSHERFIVFLT